MQEFMILPTGACSFTEAMKIGSEVYHSLKSVIKSKNGQDATNVGDEGGLAPNIQDNKLLWMWQPPNSDKSKWLSGEKLANLYKEFIQEYPIVSIEDPFDQDDWSAWSLS
ncbi:enolase C-terminal domain-like protein [Gigaspora rosea]|uniref:phosphopyruvate hydratase n=1 Tax=Gigaspora rosea TaxID=44941 RepID=A0A397UXT9_9GLOM|nr:enolase C-terminal domain-like protein [Gigaspora rosea]